MIYKSSTHLRYLSSSCVTLNRSKSRQIATTIWKLANSGVKDKNRFSLLLADVVDLKSFSSHDVANIVQGLNKAHYEEPRIWRLVTDRAFDFKKWSAIDQWTVLHGLSAAKSVDKDQRIALFRSAADAIKTHEVSDKGLASLCQSYVKTLHGFKHERRKWVLTFANEFFKRDTCSVIGTALVAKAVASVDSETPSDVDRDHSLWQSISDSIACQDISAFEWLMLLDAYVTRGSFKCDHIDNESGLKEFALKGQKIATELNSDGITRATLLFTRFCVMI